MKKKILRIAFFVIITIIMILVLFLANDISEIGQILKKIKPIWLLTALGFLIIYFFIIFIRSASSLPLPFLLPVPFYSFQYKHQILPHPPDPAP